MKKEKGEKMNWEELTRKGKVSKKGMIERIKELEEEIERLKKEIQRHLEYQENRLGYLEKKEPKDKADCHTISNIEGRIESYMHIIGLIDNL